MTELGGSLLGTVFGGPLWAFMVTPSEEAQDNGAFTDEDGAQESLQANKEQVVAKAQWGSRSIGRPSRRRRPSNWPN